MKLKDIITEIHLEKGKWTVIPHNEIEQFEQRILDLIQRTYAPIGGHPNFKTTKDIANPKNDYEVYDKDGDQQPDATSITKKTPAGIKMVGTAHDGSKDSIRTIIRHKIDLLNPRGYFAEVSGKMKDILVNNNVPVVNDQATVEKALAGKTITWHGDGTYSREIGGHTFVKTMVGKPAV